MKTIKAFITLLILALLLSSAPTTRLCPTQAAEPQVDAAPTDRTVEPLNTLNDADAAEQLPSAVQSPADDWRIETVDSGKDIGGFTSLALDESSGQFHLVYGNNPIKYAWHDGATWHTEDVPDTGQEPSLALDGLGRPHISHLKVIDWRKYIMHAWRDGTIWRTEKAELCANMMSGWEDCWDPVLAVDTNTGHLHIVYEYYERTGGYFVRYVWYDGTTWHDEWIDGGSVPSMALDVNSGWPRISYTNYDGLQYKWFDGTNWHTETVDGNMWHSSLALDKAGWPHISYETQDELRYARYDGETWHIETIPTDNQTISYVFLALDKADRPHIVYYDCGNHEFNYTWHNGMIWLTEIVPTDNAGDIGWTASMALDAQGRPHISYYDPSNNEVKHVRRLLPPLSLNKQADSNDELRNDDVLTYTLTLFGPGLNINLWDPLPTNVHYVTGSITSTIAPAAVYSPTTQAVVWDGTLPTDTVQVVQFQVTSHITGTGALLVPLSIANTAWLTDTENGTTISATASVTVTPGPLFLDKQATPRDGLRNNNTLTYTLTLSGPGLNVRLWDLLPANVYYITDSITSTLTPLAVYSPTIKTVIWEGALPTDTVQEVRFQVTPGITGTEALSLSQPIVNTAWLTVTAGVESGRSVSAMVIVNGRHVYLPLVLRQFP